MARPLPFASNILIILVEHFPYNKRKPEDFIIMQIYNSGHLVKKKVAFPLLSQLLRLNATPAHLPRLPDYLKAINPVLITDLISC